MSIHHVEQANPCVEAACVLCGAWDPDDPANDDLIALFEEAR